MFIHQRFLILFIVLRTSSGQIFLSQCQSCCRELIPQLVPSPPLIPVENCETGCRLSGLSFNVQCGTDPGFDCQFGIQWRNNGVATVDVPDEGLLTKFCVNGQVSDTQAPTSSPTLPTPAPTSSPVEEIITLPPGSADNSDLTLIIGAAGGVGGLLCILVCLMLLLPRRRRNENVLVAEEVDEYSREEKRLKNVINRPVAPVTILTRSRRPSLQSARLTLATMNETINFDALTVTPHRVEFEIMFDFDAEHKDELTAKVGEILVGVAQVNEEWWLVKREATGEEGMIPTSFMKELLPDLPPTKPNTEVAKQATDDDDDIF